MKTSNYLALSLVGLSACTQVEIKPKPNIVLIIADDLTFRDLGCYGSKDAVSPNIDRLAAEGLQFNQFFQSSSVSSPTRMSLLTGIYPVRLGAFPNHSFIYDGFTTLPQYLKDAGYRVAMQGKRHFNPVEAFPFEYLSGGNADININRIEPFIAEVAESQEPFFLYIASNDPHSPWNRGECSLFEANTLTLPPYLVDTEETREAYVRYLAEVQKLDEDIGKIDELLKKYGLDENTIFIFTGEQGHSFPFAKWTCYDAGIQTAFIMRWNGVIKPGTVTKALCEYTDVVPTLLEIAGAQIPDDLDGRSFLDVIKGKTDTFKEYIFAQHTSRGIIQGPEYYGTRAVRSDKYSYIINFTPEAIFENVITSDRDVVWQSWLEKAKTDEFAQQQVYRFQNRPAEEFYDIVNDPFQMNNMIDDPRYAEEIKTLSAKLKEWMHQQGDEGQATEMRALERQWRNRSESE